MSEQPEKPSLPPPEYEGAADLYQVDDYRAVGPGPGRWGTPIKILGVLALLFAGCALMLSQLEWTKGRPLRGRRRAKRKSIGCEGPTPARDAAAHWKAIAADEHESVATFSELALDLLAAGAPAALVTRCHEAALEETRHTEACLAIAQQLDGEPATPPDVPSMRRTRRRPRLRTVLLVRLAVESYVDGCVGEASSGWVLAQLRKHAESESIRDALRVLSREEMGHARLGRDIVEWCRAEGGPVVDQALAVTRQRLARMTAPRTDAKQRVKLREFGVPDDDLRAEGFEWARARAA
ncbi:MAG: ferritin-like domain-containing protein [Myxococcota bacterium]